MSEGVSCIYSDKCPDVGIPCAMCEYFDSGDYTGLMYKEYLRCIIEAQLEYLEIIKEYSDGNDEVVV